MRRINPAARGMLNGSVRPLVKVFVWPRRSDRPGIKPTPTGHTSAIFQVGDEIVGYSSQAPVRGAAALPIGPSVVEFSTGGGPAQHHRIHWRYPDRNRMLEHDFQTYGRDPYLIEFPPGILNPKAIGRELLSQDFLLGTGVIEGPPTREQGYILASAEIEAGSPLALSGDPSSRILSANQCITRVGGHLTQGTQGLPEEVYRDLCERLPLVCSGGTLEFGKRARSIDEFLEQVETAAERLNAAAPKEGFFPETSPESKV